MAGVNKVIIVGNLGRDPEIRYSQQGTAVVKLAVATSDVWTDKNTGQRQEKTEWHRVTVFGKMGENCERYLSKGRQVYVEGKLQTSTYEKEGQTHYSTDIIANNVQFLGGGGGAAGGGGYQGGQGGGGGYQPQGGGGYQPQGGGGYQNGGQGGGGYQPPHPPQGGGASPDSGYQGGAGPGTSPADPGMTGGGQGDDDIPF
ncbi:single-strand binding protein [Desulfocicer vacuolatum DSM 3385]|uniref:Single-stranded DNA-binding protein n=1 Tax=Desulfocicer vacuolatum DSM 3385 TaxID=1121400 RepID=A0A1W2E3V9_9BACT|nr:single-stranded DNA-binding protein [Desulfocicer vacuolatum]SMD04453.1 single-strand binding protein [Desulfocicer vacuolatum DSM 3385]